ncbi:MAG: hypothetical protein NVS1B13_19020 [Flavisolibacter sp.]
MESLLKQAQAIEMKNSCVQFMFAYQKKDVPLMLSFCDPLGDIYFKPMGAAGKGTIGSLGKQIWNLLIECFPDIDNTVDAIVSEQDNIRCQVMITGTQRKDFAGIINKGKHFESDHIFIFHLNEGGKIDKIEVEWDHSDFSKQLQ